VAPRQHIGRCMTARSQPCLRLLAAVGSGFTLWIIFIAAIIIGLIVFELDVRATSDSLTIGSFVVESEMSFQQEGEILIAEGTVSIRGKGDTPNDKRFELRPSAQAHIEIDPTEKKIRVSGETEFALRGLFEPGDEVPLFVASDYTVSLDALVILSDEGIDLVQPIGTLGVFGVTGFRILLEGLSLKGLAFDEAYVKLHEGLDFSEALDKNGSLLFPDDETADKYQGHFKVTGCRFLFETGIEFDEAEFQIENVKIGGSNWLGLESMSIRYVPGTSSHDDIWDASAQAVAPFPFVSQTSKMKGSVKLKICNGTLEELNVTAGFENANIYLAYGVLFQGCKIGFVLFQDRIEVHLEDLEFTFLPEVNLPGYGDDAFLLKATVKNVTLYSSEGAFCGIGEIRVIGDDIVAGSATFVSDPVGISASSNLFCQSDCHPTPRTGETCILCFTVRVLDSERLPLTGGPDFALLRGKYYAYVDSVTKEPTRIEGELQQVQIAGFSLGSAKVYFDIDGITDSDCSTIDVPILCVSADNLLIPGFLGVLSASGAVGVTQDVRISGEFSLHDAPRPPRDWTWFWDLVAGLGVTYENFYDYIDPINQRTMAKLEFLPEEARLGFSVAGLWLWLRYSYAQGSWNPFSELTSSSTVLVIDTSESMNWNESSGVKKLVAAKQAAGRILNMIETENRTGARHEVALVRFSETADLVLGLTADTERAREVLARLSTSGWTNIAQGLDLANTALHDSTGKGIIILLTDGVPTHSLDGTKKPRESLQVEILNGPARQAAENGYCIYVIGFGDPEEQREGTPSIDPSFLRELVRVTGCDSDYRLATEAFELGHEFIRTRQESLGRNIILDIIQSILAGETVELDVITVPTHAGRLHVTLAWPGSSLDLLLMDPRGQLVDSAYDGATISRYENLVYAIIEKPLPGAWRVAVHGQDVPSGSTKFSAIASVEPAEEPEEPQPREEAGILHIRSNGPIDLALKDPTGRIVSKELQTVEGSEYVERFDGAVGSNVDEIAIPKRMVGDYQIRVMPEPGAERLQRFDLFVTDGFDTVTLAKRKFIIHVPKEPYVIRCTETSFFDATGLPESQPNEEPNPSRALSTIILGLIAAGGIVVVGGIAGLIYFLRSHYYI